MEISPAAVRDARFDKVKRGYDVGQVDAFVAELADALEKAQNETTAMEARARAAVARLQELAHGGAAADAAPAAPSREITPDESETISRTLLLAQRTADVTLAEARGEADRVLAAARDEAASNLDAAREQAAVMVEEAKAEARRSGESERVQAESEVQSLLARRDFLESDVDHLEQFLVAQRERIAEAAAALTDIVERVPDGLADMRKPLLSAAADTGPAGDDDDGEAGEDEVGDEGSDTTPSAGRVTALGDLRAVPDPADTEDDSGDAADERPFPHDPADLESTQQIPLTDR